MNRNTRQRRALRDAFEEQNRPLSPSELLALASEKVDGLGIATVYRTIKSLLEEGGLAQVDLPGEPPRYELAGKPDHHHFQCNSCSKVFDAPGQLDHTDKLAPEGVSVAKYILVVYGTCQACLAKGSK
jgi:Fur family transcriptional regulator, ferric uptake regulator